MSDTEKPPESHGEGQTAPSEGGDKAERRNERIRERLRQAEAERDSLRQRLDAVASAEVRRELAQRITDPDAALKLSDKVAGDFLTEAGEVDAEAVGAFADEFTTARPMFDAGKKPLGTASGETQTKVRPDQVLQPRQTPGWEDVFANQRRKSG